MKGKQWKKEIMPDDCFIEDGREGDVIIVVMGLTGAGKSTFINTLLGVSVAPVGHQVESKTEYIHHYPIPITDRRVFIVDTPGFDDTYITPREILRRIAVWMAKSYSSDVKVAGIIYLQDISQDRFRGSMKRNLTMFKKLCGQEAATRIFLATTKWDFVTKVIGEEHEVAFRDKYWKDILRDGSHMRRFDGMQSSAQDIVDEILVRTALDATQIQIELVDTNKFLAETEAGRTLRYTLQELVEEQKKRLQEQDGDKRRIIDNDGKIRGLLHQINSLNVPLGWKIKRWVGL